MAARDCLNEIRGAGGEDLSDDEILEMLEELDAAAAEAARQRPWANLDDELQRQAEEKGAALREAALVEKRNRAINVGVDDKLREFLERPEFADDPYRALAALQVGSLGLTPGGRLSVAAKTTALARFWLGSLLNAVDRRGLRAVLSSRTLDREIARELWELGQPAGRGQPGRTGSPEAQETARIIHTLQERLVSRQNRAGAFIRRMPGYVVRQTHDALKIRGAGFERWYARVEPGIDERRTFGRELNAADRRDAYRAVFAELQAGKHLEALGEGDLMGEAPFKGGFNLAKKISQSRVLHFKGADDWFAYNQAFGTGGIMEQLGGAVMHAARNVAMMETWGTNPQLMHDGFLKVLDKRLIEKGSRVSDERRLLPPQVMFDTVSGASSRPASQTLTRWAWVARQTQVWSKLGSAVLSAITDTPVLAHELQRHGVSLVAGYGRGVTNLLERIADPGDKRRTANMLGAYAEGAAGDVLSRFDAGDGLPGAVSEMTRLFFKITGLTFWTDAHRAGVARAFSAGMAERLAVRFDALPASYRELLGAYGIDGDDWRTLASAVDEINGTRFVLPHRLTLEAFGDTGSPAGRRAARRARDELATKLETFFSDRMDAAVLNPGARERSILLRGTQPGTPEGEFLRAVGQFKSFPVAVLTRVWGERLRQSDYAGLAAVMMGMTVFGHLSTLARDVLQGREPPDYSDPEQWPAIAGRAFLAGGSAGIMGDFLLGEYSRYGRTLVSTMSGPLFGQADSIADLYTRVRQGDDTAAAAFKTLWENVPGANIWYARTALNYLFVYQIQEMLNPGYLRRMERRVEKETGQRFWLPPHEAA